MPGWKTFLLNALAALAVVLLEVLRMLAGIDWQAHLPGETAVWVIVAVNVANILLRHLTQGPAGWRGRRQ
ncbi:hypothetical protein [Stappia sp.]|jgi:hypothetical protein|uniref:hypothetical protein n=1 Tax=Stappia sp. TaxID=1870903 RepID=UPI003A9A6209